MKGCEIVFNQLLCQLLIFSDIASLIIYCKTKIIVIINVLYIFKIPQASFGERAKIIKLYIFPLSQSGVDWFKVFFKWILTTLGTSVTSMSSFLLSDEMKIYSLR